MRRGAALFAVALAAGVAGASRRASAEAVLTFRTDVPLAKAIEQAKTDDRLVVADLVTASCTWCKALDRDTLSSPVVARAVEPAVCVRYDAATSDGGDLVRRFTVRGFPTVLFLDGDGAEVDRIVGYRAPERFAKEAARIKSGDGTLKSLRLAHEKDPASAAAVAAYGRRLVTIGETGKARALLDAALGSQDPRAGEARGELLLGLAESWARLDDHEKALGYATRATDETPDDPAATQAWLLRVELHARRGEIEAALADAAKARDRVRGDDALATLDANTYRLLRHREETTIERWGERADAARDVENLHAAARAALDSRLALGTALRWIERAAELSGRDGSVLVTLAALLVETGAVEKAFAIAKEAEPKVRDDDARERLDLLLARLDRVWFPTPLRERPPPPPAPKPAPDGDAVPVLDPPKPTPSAPPASPAPRPPAPPAHPPAPALPLPPCPPDPRCPEPPPCPPCPPPERRCP